MFATSYGRETGAMESPIGNSANRRGRSTQRDRPQLPRVLRYMIHPDITRLMPHQKQRQRKENRGQQHADQSRRTMPAHALASAHGSRIMVDQKHEMPHTR